MKRFLFLLLFASLQLGFAAPAPERPNVVLILADDLGINDLGIYGRVGHRTPNLDRLASEGKRFTNAYAPQPVCSPTRAALLTGQHPARLQITNFLPGRPDWRGHRLLQPPLPSGLSSDAETLGEKLKKIGYATACIGKWHLGSRAPQDAASRGFDFVFAGTPNTTPSADEGGKGEFGQAAKAVEFIRDNAANPFFLYLAFDNPHVPLAAQPERVAAKAGTFNPVYAAMVETLDTAIGGVLDKIDALGLRERTLVIFCSDNGGLHVLEGNETPSTHNTPYRAGKGFLYEGGIREPLLVRWPAKISPGIVGTPVVLADMAQTIVEVTGASPCKPSDYVSLTPLLMGTGPLPDRSLFWHMPNYTNQGGRPSGAMRDGNWKLIEHYEDGRMELFDVVADPSEQNDQASVEPLRVASMRGKLEAWRRSVGASMPRGNPLFEPVLWAACYETFDPSRVELRSTAAEMAVGMNAWRSVMNAASVKKFSTDSQREASDSDSAGVPLSGLVHLEAKDAQIHGEKLRYESEPQKDTLGFWVDERDWVEWECEILQGGRYAVEILQGCTKGGSSVEVSSGDSRFQFTVVETGHYQRFVPRRVGSLELPAGKISINVKPLEKKGAIMDLRRVSLIRIP